MQTFKPLLVRKKTTRIWGRIARCFYLRVMRIRVMLILLVSLLPIVSLYVIHVSYFKDMDASLKHDVYEGPDFPEFYGKHSFKQLLQQDRLVVEAAYEKLNISSFQYDIQPKELCKLEKPLMVIIVHSAHSNFHRRDIIRLSWGRKDYLPASSRSVKVIFVLGRSHNPNATAGVVHEAEVYGDILMANFTDKYFSNTDKHVAWFQWVCTHCHRATHVLKIDDDVMVDLFQVIRYVHGVKKATGNFQYIHGFLHKNPMVTREKGYKGSVDKKHYLDDRYPTFPGGVAYITKVNTVCDLYHTSKVLPFWPLDDVYVGLLVAFVKTISLIDISHKYCVFDCGKYIETLFFVYGRFFAHLKIGIKDAMDLMVPMQEKIMEREKYNKGFQRWLRYKVKSFKNMDL